MRCTEDACLQDSGETDVQHVPSSRRSENGSDAITCSSLHSIHHSTCRTVSCTHGPSIDTKLPTWTGKHSVRSSSCCRLHSDCARVMFAWFAVFATFTCLVSVLASRECAGRSASHSFHSSKASSDAPHPPRHRGRSPCLPDNLIACISS